ncbi:hypothetical protein IW262DRAFT_1126552 [Armillaria fumosa]|nr:hypothetical protein IW262DRAFT_1126552 [Armillaria fumosa]
MRVVLAMADCVYCSTWVLADVDHRRRSPITDVYGMAERMALVATSRILTDKRDARIAGEIDNNKYATGKYVQAGRSTGDVANINRDSIWSISI